MITLEEYTNKKKNIYDAQHKIEEQMDALRAEYAKLRDELLNTENEYAENFGYKVGDIIFVNEYFRPKLGCAPYSQYKMRVDTLYANDGEISIKGRKITKSGLPTKVGDTYIWVSIDNKLNYNSCRSFQYTISKTE